ncbi:MAG: YaiI/YqxD family protein [Hyphomonas sp.]|uniref:YaiI/YqxD family protein n=1 Tax=Hyphomonas sp. TaxID=87 RepID=UPI001D723E37|nr:YaiI/YqxD family protein [Hyphomonas sp.]MBA4227004.1 YaiI/YqxD family protein [Hyphomonas sp.]
MTVRILVDADACPVKDEIYMVALRHQVAVVVVANSYLRIPEHALISRKIVSDGFDAADDWIAEAAGPDAIVVTADIPLADRSLKAGARVLSPSGKPFTDDSIGTALATRSIMADRRVGVAGIGAGGPAPFSKADRSRFLSALDAAIVAGKRAQG